MLESVDLQDSNGAFQKGPSKPRHDHRSLKQIRRSHIVGCCICRRLAGIYEEVPDLTDDLRTIPIQYSITDFKGYYQVRVYVRAKAPTDRSIYGGNSLDFDLLPGPIKHRPEVDCRDSISPTSLEKARSYVQWRMSACKNNHSECRRGNWWRPEVVGIEHWQHWRPEEVEDVWQPTRLLRISEGNNRDPVHVRLVETADAPCVPYLALSHCWGGVSSHKLHADSRTQLTEGNNTSTNLLQPNILT